MIMRISFTLISLLLAFQVSAGVVTKNITYKAGDTEMKGMLAFDNTTMAKRPGVLVIHEWWGHNDYARKRAKMLAQLGYVALAVDMYGGGKTAAHPDDAGKFANAVGGNPELAKQRYDAALKTLKQQLNVDGDKIAAIGYCFGGGILLNMARMGTDINGVVSFHGSLATKNPAKKGDIVTRIRVFNGEADPFVKPEHIKAFEEEMKAAGADYKLVNYPGAKHSFTSKEATAKGKKFGLPLEYNALADKDSWLQTQAFFKEIFGETETGATPK